MLVGGLGHHRLLQAWVESNCERRLLAKHALDAIRSAADMTRAIKTGFSFSIALTCSETSGLLGTKNQIKQAAMNAAADSRPNDNPMTRERVGIVGLEFVGVFRSAYLRAEARFVVAL